MLDELNSTFSFKEVEEREIYEEILKLDRNKGPGIDDLHVKAIKYVADVISTHLCLLFNSSIANNVYPNVFKTAKCVPIFKGGDLDPLNPVSYRPISVLNSMNKVLEKLIEQMDHRIRQCRVQKDLS